MYKRFSSETTEARMQWDDISSANVNDYQIRILYSAKLSFKKEGKIRTFTDKQKPNSSLAYLPYKK